MGKNQQLFLALKATLHNGLHINSKQSSRDDIPISEHSHYKLG